MSNLIVIEKDGERLPVHPRALAEHQKLGWRVAEDQTFEATLSASTSEDQGIGTDSGDQFSEDELRKIIEQETGEKVHHRTGREKLIEAFDRLNAAAAE